MAGTVMCSSRLRIGRWERMQWRQDGSSSPQVLCRGSSPMYRCEGHRTVPHRRDSSLLALHPAAPAQVKLLVQPTEVQSVAEIPNPADSSVLTSRSTSTWPSTFERQPLSNHKPQQPFEEAVKPEQAALPLAWNRRTAIGGFMDTKRRSTPSKETERYGVDVADVRVAVAGHGAIRAL